MCNCNFRIYICLTNIYSLLCNGSSNIFSFCNISRDNSSCPHKIRFYHRSKLIGIQSNKLQRQSKNRTDGKNYTKYPHSFIRACLETHLSIMKRFNSMLAMAI